MIHDQGVVKALEYYKRNKVFNRITYQYNNSLCVIGSMFSSPQLADITARKLNGETIDVVAARIGENNILQVTGLDISELGSLQELNDHGDIDNLIFKLKYLRKVLKK